MNKEGGLYISLAAGTILLLTVTRLQTFARPFSCPRTAPPIAAAPARSSMPCATPRDGSSTRSEENTSELQSRREIVCRLMLENKRTGHEVPVDCGHPARGARRLHSVSRPQLRVA